MNLAVGSLVLMGLLIIVLGIISKFVGASLLTPYIEAPSSYFMVAITCFVLSLVIDRFEKK